MKSIYHLISIIILLLSGCQVDDAILHPDKGYSDQFAVGKGIVRFNSYEPLQNKPVNIHYFVPASGNPRHMPVLLLFPGTERNANDYLGAWIAEATTKKVMVFALEFPKEHYSASEYIEGGLFKNAVQQDEKEWTFSLIDPVFEYIKKSLDGTQQQYDIWGHSAGAQFVERFMLFKSGTKVNRALAANPGWYTLPDLNKNYPYGLAGTSFADSSIQKVFFSKNLILALGKADILIDENLNTTAGANAQGKNRYERGLYFWAESGRIARLLNQPLCWGKTEVPGVGHDYRKMATATAPMLYP